MTDTQPTTSPTQTWEKIFDKKFTAFENVCADKTELKQFISTELRNQATELLGEVEELIESMNGWEGKDYSQHPACGGRHDVGNFEEDSCNECYAIRMTLAKLVTKLASLRSKYATKQ